MLITVILYGNLKEKQESYIGPSPYKTEIYERNIKIVADILKIFNIEENEVSHIFVNSKYCGPGKEVKNGDRVGIFPINMGIMFVEIPHLNSIQVNVKIIGELQKYGGSQSSIFLPQGSSGKAVLKKYGISLSSHKLKFEVNGRFYKIDDYILEDNDFVVISSTINNS